MMYNRFIALDFETSTHKSISACAIGIAVVENLIITDKFYSLIKPPVRTFSFTHIHGITWNDVKDKPTFGELWNDIKQYFRKIDFIAAHNSIFDSGIFNACCDYYCIKKPAEKFQCTCSIAREKLKLRDNTLATVSGFLGIELQHHNALSDAMACAEIMIRFLKYGGI